MEEIGGVGAGRVPRYKPPTQLLPGAPLNPVFINLAQTPTLDAQGNVVSYDSGTPVSDFLLQKTSDPRHSEVEGSYDSTNAMHNFGNYGVIYRGVRLNLGNATNASRTFNLSLQSHVPAGSGFAGAVRVQGTSLPAEFRGVGVKDAGDAQTLMYAGT